MQSFQRSALYMLGFILLALACHAGEARAATAKIEVQGVWANDKDKNGIPKSLAHYKPLLQGMNFSSFKDMGRETIKPAAGGSGAAKISDYTIAVEVQSLEAGQCTVSVTPKHKGKAMGDPVQMTLKKGEPKQLFRFGDEKAPLVVFITLEDVQ